MTLPRECATQDGFGECLWYGVCQQTITDCPGMEEEDDRPSEGDLLPVHTPLCR